MSPRLDSPLPCADSSMSFWPILPPRTVARTTNRIQPKMAVLRCCALHLPARAARLRDCIRPELLQAGGRGGLTAASHAEPGGTGGRQASGSDRGAWSAGGGRTGTRYFPLVPGGGGQPSPSPPRNRQASNVTKTPAKRTSTTDRVPSTSNLKAACPVASQSTIFQKEPLRLILPSVNSKRSQPRTSTDSPVALVPRIVHSDTPRSPHVQWRSSP